MAERVVYGKNAVIEALEAGLAVRRLYLAKRSHAAGDRRLEAALRGRKILVSQAPRPTLDRLAGDTHHQGVVAVLESYRFLDLPGLLARAAKGGPNPVLLACDRITDPRNLGAILRSCEALGGAGVILPERRSATITATVEKAAAGATAHLPIAQVTNLSDALARTKEQGYWAVGASSDNGEPAYSFDFRRPTVLVIGSEGKGLGRRVEKNCDALVTVPLQGKVASLNASIAAALLLYEIQRQRLRPDSIR